VDDSSTQLECREITEALGGPKQVAGLTGSVATERFAGPQIRKFWKRHPEEYASTFHIALVSSFLTPCDRQVAPVDAATGTDQPSRHSIGPLESEGLGCNCSGLLKRLPRLQVKDEIIGPVSPYLANRFGFKSDALVVVVPATTLAAWWAGPLGGARHPPVSLGTSDTYFGYMRELEDRESPRAHLRTADGRFMALVCFKNGSLAREAVKNWYGLNWDDLSRILLETAPGNQGKIMLPYFLPKLPLLCWSRKSGASAASKPKTSGAIFGLWLRPGYGNVFALRLDRSRPKGLLVTAGGSENLGLLTVISQVFGAEVRSLRSKKCRPRSCHSRRPRVSRYMEEGGRVDRTLRVSSEAQCEKIFGLPLKRWRFIKVLTACSAYKACRAIALH